MTVPADTADSRAELSYLQEVFARLVEFKRLPKYQFERRVDAFLVGFLPELLGHLLGGRVEPVVPEFPLKKPNSNQSTNVDHVFFVHQDDREHDYWLFLELKTDMGSVGQVQVDTYAHYAGLGMERLFNDVLLIQAASTHAKKYTALLKYFEGLDRRRPIKVVYLSPAEVIGLPLSDTFRNVTFAQLADIEVRQHAEAWQLFRSIVLPSLLPPSAPPAS